MNQASASQDFSENREITKYKIVAYLTLLLPFLSFLFVIFNFKKFTTSLSVDLILFCGFYLLTSIGISVGFHRGIAHKSYKPTRFIKIILAILGSMAAQGSPLFWVATHRRHHVYSDTIDDIHSPHTSSNRLLGFFHAHVAWMTKGKMSNPARFAKDIVLDTDLRWISKNYLVWILLGIIIPGLISLGIYGTLHAFVEGILWGGLTRIFVVHHVTWGINSLAHLVGGKKFQTGDHSHNIALLSLLSFGESWHNNHHAFPYSAKFGLFKRQLDIGYYIIWVLSKLRLITDVKKPSAEKILAQMI